jgi:UDP-N-acetylmuramoyl-L-alanyl-D-glutamate--2,6-diaminopimelate ligase
MSKSLRELTEHAPGVAYLTRDAEITAPVVEDNREVEPGGIFVARRGLTVDGHDFIDDAIERGAAAIVGEHELYQLPVPYVRVKNAQEATGYLAAAYHDFPSRKLLVIGITGTDGKTTTATLLHSILKVATKDHVGLISTVAADLGAASVDTGLHVTTPSAPQIQALLAKMVANGLTHCVLEMTSHGLAQGRLNGVDVDIAVLTNLTHEHLDFHGSFENYRAAKARLFEMLSASPRNNDRPTISIINADDPNADFFTAIPADQHMTYGLSDKADYQAVDIAYHADGTHFNIFERRAQQTHRDFHMPLVGEFNVLNALAALETYFTLGLASGFAYEGLAQSPIVPGRMERIDEGQNFSAIVDFAHTPNSLEKALNAARTMVAEGGRLIVVFGSAGLRDREKRRLMAETGARLADFTILTAEDPRTESLDDILQTMAEAATAAGGVEGETFIRVPDRGAALYQACQMARAGDVVIACGKGHEQSMCFGTIEYPWDDREALRLALRGTPKGNLPTSKRV